MCLSTLDWEKFSNTVRFQLLQTEGTSMNRVAVACVGLLALAGGSATAAELAPYYQPGPAYNPIYTWTGFYVGINGGGGWGNSQWDGLNSFDVSGGLIGGTVGYNWQFGQAVVGAEGDIDWSGIKGTTTVLALGAARPATSGSPPRAGGSAWPSTASCRTSPAGSRSATSTPPCRSCRAAASATPAGPWAPASKSASSAMCA